MSFKINNQQLKIVKDSPKFGVTISLTIAPGSQVILPARLTHCVKSLACTFKLFVIFVNYKN